MQDHVQEPELTTATVTDEDAAVIADDADDLVEDVSIDGLCGVY